MEKWVDYYNILQVSQLAKADVIQSKYKKLCKLYHPDINHSPLAEDKMKMINIAYGVLGDESKRRVYHQQWLRRNRQSPYATTGQTAGRQADHTGGASPGRTGPGGAGNGKTGSGSPGASDGSRRWEEPDFEAAKWTVSRYFHNLSRQMYSSAYSLLSSSDRAGVPYSDFELWQKLVAGIYTIREFNVLSNKRINAFAHNNALYVAERFNIDIRETEVISSKVSQYTMHKYAVYENTQWRVCLGYSDLKAIIADFQKKSATQKRTHKPDSGAASAEWEAVQRRQAAEPERVVKESPERVAKESSERVAKEPVKTKVKETVRAAAGESSRAASMENAQAVEKIQAVERVKEAGAEPVKETGKKPEAEPIKETAKDAKAEAVKETADTGEETKKETEEKLETEPEETTESKTGSDADGEENLREQMSMLMPYYFFLHESELESYRFQRYKRPFVIAAMQVDISRRILHKAADSDAIAFVGKSLYDSLRGLDAVCYLGKRQFAVMLSEIKLNTANSVMTRVMMKIRRGALSSFGLQIKLRLEMREYGGGNVEHLLDSCVWAL